MSKEYFHKIIAYKATLFLVRDMLSKGLINEEEYAKIDTILAPKYGLSLCSIYA